MCGVALHSVLHRGEVEVDGLAFDRGRGVGARERFLAPDGKVAWKVSAPLTGGHEYEPG